MSSILFLLKKNLVYGSYSSVIAKSGLLNSAKITSQQLEKYLKVDTAIEVCVDGNEVDKFLSIHRPNICIIEAIWLTPEKLKEVQRLHKNVLFVVLVHSEIPFLAQEGVAIKWIKEYIKIGNVHVGFNSKDTYDQFNQLGIFGYYLPNIYFDVEKQRDRKQNPSRIIDIGCFGSIRPFKNQLMQAVAAIVFANLKKKILHFHINSTRLEQGGENVLKNLRALFEFTEHSLIEHAWTDRETFMVLIGQMDLGMQVSLSESFNLVTAQFVEKNVPIVVSKTISWMPSVAQCEVDNLDDILTTMSYAYNRPNNSASKNVKYLTRYNKSAIEAWREFLGG